MFLPGCEAEMCEYDTFKSMLMSNTFANITEACQVKSTDEFYSLTD